MIDVLSLVFGLIAGMMFGTIFFGGLLWTVHKGVSAKHPAFWFLGSMLLRTCIVVLGFYFILGNSWQRLVAGLLGFIFARLIIMRFARVAQQQNQLVQEAGHAP